MSIHPITDTRASPSVSCLQVPPQVLPQASHQAQPKPDLTR
ncbi:hypothetical protein LUZ100_gp55 [Pseudomonas phage LUZ100]|uniref:Uncharacterized protein n=1 Tax=Pseudomonas phage LUZ100 TaxID=2973522 RepID=A0A9Y1DIC1_9CAUD|nr:hypothetical protein LUZ100_gp55 [Pseudomonas phage LUZ100]